MSLEGVTKDKKMKDSLWGKEKRWFKVGGEKFSTGTGVPAPELVLYILLMLTTG